MTIDPTLTNNNTRFNRACRVWMMPAAALALLAGTSTTLAQDGAGFGLNEAMNEMPLEELLPEQPEWDNDSASDEDLGDLDGSVGVNEYDLVDLHVNNEDLGNILQLLSIQSQRNIISSKEVSATITADLYGVTFYEALDSILHVNGYGYIEKGNFIYVYTREQIEEIVRANRTRVTRVVSLDYLNSTDAAEFAKQLLSDAGSITTTAATEPFTISETPSGADNYANSATLVINDYEENAEEILELLTQLDTKPAQVLVEATILQTSLNEANAFGVDFALIKNLDFSDFLGSGGPMGVVNDLLGGSGQTIDGTDVDLTNSNGSGVSSGPGNTGGSSTLKAGIVSGDVAVFMRVLDEVTDVTVVSNPKILTLNRQPARVLVGTKVGYLNTTTTETATTQTVEFLDVGTELAVRPFVSKSGLIRLELRPQVSSFKLRQVTDNTGSNVTIPDEDTTEMTTNIMVRDGQTAVIGGLFTETTTTSRRQVPLLGDIPLIGNAFKGFDDGTIRSEIIFLITPSIINDTTLAESGDLGVEYAEQARFGARKSLLPWSRERRVGQLLIDASNLADHGETELALAKIDRALRLSPASPDARQMRSELSNTMEIMPSRSMLEGILHDANDTGSMVQSNEIVYETVDRLADQAEYTEYEPETDLDSAEDVWVEPETLAEVPTESVSDASDTDNDSFEQWVPEEETYAEVAIEEDTNSWTTADAEVPFFEDAPLDLVEDSTDDFDSTEFEVAEFEAEEFDAEEVQYADEFYADSEFETLQDEGFDAGSDQTIKIAQEDPFMSSPVYTEIPVDSAFDVPSSSQSLTNTAAPAKVFESMPFSSEPTTETEESVDSVLKTIMGNAEGSASNDAGFTQSAGSPVEIVQETASSDSHSHSLIAGPKSVAAGKFSGLLVIPLPSGGALQLDWPMSMNDWSNSTFSSVETGDELVDEISD